MRQCVWVSGSSPVCVPKRTHRRRRRVYPPSTERERRRRKKKEKEKKGDCHFPYSDLMFNTHGHTEHWRTVHVPASLSDPFFCLKIKITKREKKRNLRQSLENSQWFCIRPVVSVSVECVCVCVCAWAVQNNARLEGRRRKSRRNNREDLSRLFFLFSFWFCYPIKTKRQHLNTFQLSLFPKHKRWSRKTVHPVPEW
jgi:hypothetical protein